LSGPPLHTLRCDQLPPCARGIMMPSRLANIDILCRVHPGGEDEQFIPAMRTI